ncbi:hypothetical protein ACILE2_11275, partial [Capnocytophaga canimorsus]|uniref:hypothetical protein n=1 Tax=Capnocytophaga canimorsus TaxID=28188 RepID=UPI0037D81838
MTSIQLFNELNGKEVSRNYLEEILQQAKTENQTDVIYRVSKILNDYPNTKHFDINIVQYPQGLAGAMHTGDYREALDDCGRLRKGWKFVKGNVVKVEKKEKKEKPKKQKAETEYKITPEIRLQYPKSYTDADIIASMKKMDKFREDVKAATCKTCDKKYKFLIYKTQTSNKYTLAFSFADLAGENKSVFDFRKTHKGNGYNEFFVINNAILLEKYKKGTDYLILSKSDFDKKEFYKHLEKQEIKNTENQEETKGFEMLEKNCKTCEIVDKKQNSVEKSSNALTVADDSTTKLNILLSSTEKENQSAKDIQNIFDK